MVPGRYTCFVFQLVSGSIVVQRSASIVKACIIVPLIISCQVNGPCRHAGYRSALLSTHACMPACSVNAGVINRLTSAPVIWISMRPATADHVMT